MARQISLSCADSEAQLCINGKSADFYFIKICQPEHWYYLLDGAIALWKSEFPDTTLTTHVDIDDDDLGWGILDRFGARGFAVTEGTQDGYILTYQPE